MSNSKCSVKCQIDKVKAKLPHNIVRAPIPTHKSTSGINIYKIKKPIYNTLGFSKGYTDSTYLHIFRYLS